MPSIFDGSRPARAEGMTEAQYMELMAVIGMASHTNRLANDLQIPVDDAFKIS